MPITLYTHAVFNTATGSVSLGSITTPKVVELSDDVRFEREVDVAASTTETLFNTTNDLDDFEFLWIEADGSVYLELTTDNNGSIGDEPWTCLLTADAPFILGSDNSYANYTVNFGGGTIDVIDRIRVRNTGTSTVRVRLVAGT